MEFKRHALILGVIEALRRHGSRTGKTHVQKTFFLGSAADCMPVPFGFFLYKHGPYSPDIENELEQMRSYAAISVEPALDGYGVVLCPDEMAPFVKCQAPLTSAERDGIERVCAFVAPRNVAQLERLATAAWIRTREDEQDPDAVAARLHELKPHISVFDAAAADRELAEFLIGS